MPTLKGISRTFPYSYKACWALQESINNGGLLIYNQLHICNLINFKSVYIENKIYCCNCNKSTSHDFPIRTKLILHNIFLPYFVSHHFTISFMLEVKKYCNGYKNSFCLFIWNHLSPKKVFSHWPWLYLINLDRKTPQNKKCWWPFWVPWDTIILTNVLPSALFDWPSCVENSLLPATPN